MTVYKIITKIYGVTEVVFDNNTKMAYQINELIRFCHHALRSVF